jgi:hypothetical protein
MINWYPLTTQSLQRLAWACAHHRRLGGGGGGGGAECAVFSWLTGDLLESAARRIYLPAPPRGLGPPGAVTRPMRFPQ